MEKSKVLSQKSRIENAEHFGVAINRDLFASDNDSGLLTQYSRLPKGFSLLELIITIMVLAVMVLTALPLAQNAVRRQKEQQLREALREMRLAIDEFKRDTLGACPQGAITSTNPTPGGRRPGVGQNVPADPRSRVVIDDCEIFKLENLDRFPPTLEILVEGVVVKPRGPNIKGGGVFDDDTTVFSDAPKEVKKYYLREIPIDPITGEKNWKLRSTYQAKDDDAWDSVNVFDVRSASEEEAMNGEKYSDW